MPGIGDMARGASSNAMAASMAQPAVDDGEESNVSPEEQAAYEQVVRNALKIIYPEGADDVSPAILQGIKASPDNPLMALAVTTVTVVTGLRDSAKQANSPIPDEVLYHAAVAIIEELAEVAEATKIHDFSEDDIEQAFYLALDMYRTAGEQTGDVDKGQLTQGWEEIKRADAEGRLGEVLPGIESRMKGDR